MEGKGIYVILLGIIAVLTLSVAVLVIFLFVTFNNPAPATEASASESSTAETGPKLVPSDQLVTYNPFGTEKEPEAVAVYDLQPSELHPNSFVQVTMLMKYDVGEKRAKEAEYKALIQEEAASEIKQACSMYFKGLTYEDCKSPEAIPKAQDHLKQEFNRIIDENAGEKIQVVYKVIIENMLPQ